MNTVKTEEIKKPPLPICEACKTNGEITLCGMIIDVVQVKVFKDGKCMVRAYLTDFTDSVTFKFYTKDYAEWKEKYSKIIEKDKYVTVCGNIEYDENEKEPILFLKRIYPTNASEERSDLSKEKRVELHLHTKMSKMDGVTSVGDYIWRAAKWGHKAIEITDHAVVQAFPQAMLAAEMINRNNKDYRIKILYGVEVYLIDSDSDKCNKIDTADFKPYHAVIYAKNMIGLKNLYELVSESHINYFYGDYPCVPKKLYKK